MHSIFDSALAHFGRMWIIACVEQLLDRMLYQRKKDNRFLFVTPPRF